MPLADFLRRCFKESGKVRLDVLGGCRAVLEASKLQIGVASCSTPPLFLLWALRHTGRGKSVSLHSLGESVTIQMRGVSSCLQYSLSAVEKVLTNTARQWCRYGSMRKLCCTHEPSHFEAWQNKHIPDDAELPRGGSAA